MILLYLAVAAFYAGAAWLRSRGDPHGRVAASLVAIALSLHGVTLFLSIWTPGGLDLSFLHALSLVAWLTVIVAGASGLVRQLPAAGTVILPVAALCALLPLLGDGGHRMPYAIESLATAHIAVALVAYAAFVVAALQALLLAGIEKRLHRGLAPSADATPPLLTLERFLFRLVAIGFALLTLTLVSGFLFSEQVFGKALTFSHKNFFSLAGWLVFAVLLAGRWRYGWRGRRALAWILAGTALLVLGYLGSKFVSEILLGR